MESLFVFGCGVITGHLLARLGRQNDPHKALDVAMLAVGLVAIVVSFVVSKLTT